MEPYGIIIRCMIIFVSVVVWGSSPVNEGFEAPKLRLVAEMEPIRHLVNGIPIEWKDKSIILESDLNLKMTWEMTAKPILRQINSELIQSISKWARTETAGFQIDPSKIIVEFRPIHWTKAKRTLVYEANLSLLPSHHPLVSRWLKLFLVYSPSKSEIEELFLTIQGQVLE